VNRRICENLEAQAQALFKHWFIDFAPFKNGKFVESELGMIPEGWRVGTLGEIAEISSGKRPKSRYNNQTKEHNIPLIGASCIMGYTDDIFTSNRILLTGRVGTLGVVQRFNSACWPSDNTLVLSTNFYEFVYQTIKTVNYSAMNRGTSQPLITQGDLKKTLITIPSNSILNKYEEVAGDIMSYIDFHFKESTRLSTLRDTLLPKLMSGQIKV
jgi:type I restriction enzyme S subunit